MNNDGSRISCSGRVYDHAAAVGRLAIFLVSSLCRRFSSRNNCRGSLFSAPTAAYGAKWGGFVINAKTFTTLVYSGRVTLQQTTINARYAFSVPAGVRFNETMAVIDASLEGWRVPPFHSWTERFSKSITV